MKVVDKPVAGVVGTVLVADVVGTVAVEIVGYMSRVALDSVVPEHNHRHEPAGSDFMLVLTICNPASEVNSPRMIHYHSQVCSLHRADSWDPPIFCN